MNLYKLGFPNSEQFFIKEIGDKILIHRKEAGVKWDEHNKYFRSSLWHKETGKLLSAGFRAFVNYGEQSNFEPLNSEDGVRAIQKIDGSLLCVSNPLDELIIRTRGTVDASRLQNGHEIEFLKKKYPKAFANEWLDCGLYTLLFEWTTPTNRIVLNESTEPTLWLIGMVYHPDYSYVNQHNLDTYAKEMEVNRPKSYGIMLNGSIEDIKKRIEPLQDIEGVVIYDDKAGYNSGQILKKIKTLRYLQLHRVFTGVKTVDHLFDLFVEYGCTERENFEALLATNFDWELVVSLKDLIDELYLEWKRIHNQFSWMRTYISNPDFVNLSRKEQAISITHIFKEKSGIAFAVLDNKEITPEKLWKTFNG